MSITATVNCKTAVNDNKRIMRLTIKFHFHGVQYHGAVDFSICFCCL